MKQFLLIILSFSLYSNNLISQITITADDIAPTGVIAQQTIDETPDPSILEGADGNLNWDFSLLADGVSTTFVLEPGETPYQASFPSANLASSVDGELYAFMNMDDQKIEIIGIEGELNYLGQLIQGKLEFTPGQSLIRFPATYGESYNETIIQTAQVPGTDVGFPAFDSVRLVTTVVRGVEIDAYGTMTIPTGDLETIRSSETETTSNDVFVLSNGNWSFLQGTPPETIINFNWWANENGFGFPVVQLQYNPGNGTREVKWLQQFITNTNERIRFDFDIYPNPASSYLNIHFPDAISGSVEIAAINGKTALKQVFENSQYETINTTILSSGSYYLVLKNEEGQIIGYEKLEITK